eukprot:954966_1
MPLACSVELRDDANVTSVNDNEFNDIIGIDIIGHKLCNNPTNKYGDVLGICDIENCHMYDGDTMDGKPLTTEPATTEPATTEPAIEESQSSGSGGNNEGGGRIETAPVAVDPPSDPLIYIPENEYIDVDIPSGSIGVGSSCNNLENGLQYILPYGIFDEDLYPLL